MGALYLENDLLFAFIIIVLVINGSFVEKKTSDEKLYLYTMISVATLLIVDGLAWFFNGMQSNIARIGVNTFNILYFSFTAISSCFWFFYVLSKVDLLKYLKKYHYFLICLPMITLIIMSIISPWTKCIFYTNSNNEYEKGNLYFMQAILSYVYILAATIVSIRKLSNKKLDYIKRLDYLLLVIFGLAAFIASIVQLFLFGIDITWKVVSVVMLLIFINMNNSRISKDPLTGLLNKAVFEQNSSRLLNKKNSAILFIIDVDNFKLVNDRFGHRQGDLVLIQIANLIKQYFPTNSLIGRVGGDEFAVFVSSNIFINIDMNSVEKFLKSVNDIVLGDDFHLSCSIGASTTLNNEINSYVDLLILSDNAMYDSKYKGRNCISIANE